MWARAGPVTDLAAVHVTSARVRCAALAEGRDAAERDAGQAVVFGDGVER